MSNEKEIANDNISKNTATVEMTRGGKNSAMDVSPDYAIDALLEED